ncbi:hypothetical protein FAES_0610 [Fibrella aestuarina BUZ 2]|uniref:Outer membrane protein beta-barrel domain-containing protein n=1 Tax=Fibrella aestuarina BUZ 2 TaxID=1166018 RepID=I0K3B8_9BACT|nr:hypothetical protein [Fibrella aestuarina]CCG98621.1 hypothetical protein FAES_0610 [Fibrella aestuarina BUZ 2]
MNRSDDYIMGSASGSPNDQWKRVFDDASEAPPPRVWDAVERQLDLDDEDGIIPLWQHRQGQQSMLFGRWAAGIAASLLLTLFGWWAWHRDDGLRPGTTGSSQMAVAPKPVPAAGAAQPSIDEPATQPDQLASRSARPERPATLAANVPVRASRVAKQHPTAAPTADQPEVTETPLVAAASTPVPEPTQPAAKPSMTFNEQVVITQRVASRGTFGQVTMSMTSSMAPSNRSMPTMSFRQSQPVVGTEHLANAHSVANTTITPQVNVPGAVPPSVDLLVLDNASPDRLVMNLAPLSIQPLSVRAVGNDRIVWYKHDEAAETTAKQADVSTAQSRTEHRKAWVSAGVAAASFNPTLAMRSSAVASMANVNSGYNSTFNNLAANPATINAQTGSAMTVQVNAGLPLSEHWAIETGVGYLSSQASVQSPGRATYASVADKGSVGNVSNQTLYTDLISSRLSNQSVAYSPSAANGLINDFVGTQNARYQQSAGSTVSNSYQFVQVPAQVSYEFRPRRKFGLALLTGLVSNWFVRNTVNQTIDVKPGDGIYRPVTMAGTAGVRVRYRPDRHWSASMAGMYQQHLQSLTLNDVNLQALPQQVGLSFSVDRHF